MHTCEGCGRAVARGGEGERGSRGMPTARQPVRAEAVAGGVSGELMGREGGGWQEMVMGGR